MAARYLYAARHGMADAFGELTDVGRRQADLLGRRLAQLPVTTVWHSPLPRAAASAQLLARHLPNVPVREAGELVDHIPHVPPTDLTPRAWRGFFDGYDPAQAASGRRTADALVARFAGPRDRPTAAADTNPPSVVHEVLVTHAYPIAWLVRDALDAPPGQWLGLTAVANAALTTIEYHDGLPPSLTQFNDMSHLPAELRWTGFAPGIHP